MIQRSSEKRSSIVRVLRALIIERCGMTDKRRNEATISKYINATIRSIVLHRSDSIEDMVINVTAWSI